MGSAAERAPGVFQASVGSERRSLDNALETLTGATFAIVFLIFIRPALLVQVFINTFQHLRSIIMSHTEAKWRIAKAHYKVSPDVPVITGEATLNTLLLMLDKVSRQSLAVTRQRWVALVACVDALCLIL